MKRPLTAACLALTMLGNSASVVAQDTTGAPSRVDVMRDSADVGRMAGAEAARHRGVGDYFAAGLLSGLPIGMAGPVAVGEFTPDVPPVLITAAGVAGVVGVSLHASRADVTLPATEEERLQQHSVEYQQGFRNAYTTVVHGRRKRAAVWGSVTGALAGVGAFLLLLTNIRT
ncbi:MAG TPA: hypothetical protein VIQ74_09290 [Gemmatimonadaceae bacterium]